MEDENELTEIIKKEVIKDKNITPKIISDNYNISEAKIKGIMDRICDKYDAGNRKVYYQLKDTEF